MQNKLVLTLTGKDRTGIVERVTKEVLQFGGNIEASRMARLGGEFAILMLVSISEENFEPLQQSLQSLQDDGYSITTRKTIHGDPSQYAGWLPFQVVVNGADHEGLIHKITSHLAKHEINIETMDTGIAEAPMSGTPLFNMDAVILVPPKISYRVLETELQKLGDTLNVDIELTPYKG